MAKAQGPEEFFEVFREASHKSKHRPQKAEEPADGPPPSVTEEPTPPPELAARPEPRTFPLSVFADDEPTVTIRRSTLVFCILVVLVLLFIAYALGRSGRRPARTSGPTTSRRNGVVETSRPGLPERYRNKLVAWMRVLKRTEPSHPDNARAYRDFLRQNATFLEQGGKDAFIISYDRKLVVCVGPFDGFNSQDVTDMLPKLHRLRYNDAQLFARASVRRLPAHATLFE